MVRVSGPVVPRLRGLFLSDWRQAAHRPLPWAEESLPGVLAATDADGDGGTDGDTGDDTGDGTGDDAAPAVGATGQDSVHPLVTRRSRPELARRLKEALRATTVRADIASAYFVPGLRMRRALRRTARRGVQVRLLLPGPRTDHFAVWNAGRRHYHALLKAGVRIHEFQRSMLHSKYAVLDGWGYVGSSNLDAWSRRFNLELDLGLGPGPALTDLGELFEADLADAREITLSQWEARPLTARFAETFFGWFDPLL